MVDYRRYKESLEKFPKEIWEYEVKHERVTPSVLEDPRKGFGKLLLEISEFIKEKKYSWNPSISEKDIFFTHYGGHMRGKDERHLKWTKELIDGLKKHGLEEIRAMEVAYAALVGHIMVNNNICDNNQIDCKDTNMLLEKIHNFMKNRGVYVKNGKLNRFFYKELPNMAFTYK